MEAAGLLLAAAGATWSDRAIAIVLGLGLAGLFAALVALVWTRWGQARPVAKCAALSFAAHILLLTYLYSSRVLLDQPGHWTGQTVKVHLADARDNEEAAPALETDVPQSWNQAGIDTSLDYGPGQPTRPETTLPRPERTPVPDLIPEPQPPPPARLPEQAVAASEPQAPSPELPTEPAAATPHETVAPDFAVTPLPDELFPPPEVVPPTDSAAGSTAREVASQPLSEQAPPGQAFASAPATVPRRLGDGQDVPEALRARVLADRLKIAQQFGATPSSEAAVAAALEWLAANQSEDGRWDADLHGAGRETGTLGHDRRGAGAQADTGITGLALLALLGNGETHLDGTHRVNVQKGLEFLLASQAADGNLAGNAEFFAAMYCHGIATLALSEAYALSGDERLLPGLRRALRYTISAQHSGGGWRYQPYDAGDISQFGWQLMALRSAEVGGVAMPEETRVRMVRFLRSASSGRAKGLASYRPGDRISRTMTAEALVCRYFLQAENSPAALAEAADFVMQEPPSAATTNYYYWYYGTLAMFQRQGEDWQTWNAALQRQLLHSQRFEGELRGSWDPDPMWGGYGGRVYSTATATLSLEVYYRYLPIYGGDVDQRLTDRPAYQELPR
jgi:hypothetical protein